MAKLKSKINDKANTTDDNDIRNSYKYELECEHPLRGWLQLSNL